MDEFKYVNELLMKHAKHSPNVTLLDYIERQDEYIVLYRDDGDVCTPYIIHHLTDSGLYYCRYYGKGWAARLDFDEMKHYYMEAKMIELTQEELFSAPAGAWNRVPYTTNHHKWLLEWCRSGDDGEFCFTFISPAGRTYAYYVDDGRVASAEIVAASDEAIVASFYDSWDDKPDRMDAVLRHTPKHVLDRLAALLYAVERKQGEHEQGDR